MQHVLVLIQVSQNTQCGAVRVKKRFTMTIIKVYKILGFVDYHCAWEASHFHTSGTYRNSLNICKAQFIPCSGEAFEIQTRLSGWVFLTNILDGQELKQTYFFKKVQIPPGLPGELIGA